MLAEMGMSATRGNGMQMDADRPLFAARRLGHVNLFVENIDRSVDFYRKIIGLGIAWRRTNMRTGFHSNGNSHHDIGLIDLHGPLGEAETPTLNHLAFEIETQLDLVDGYRRALSTGFGFTAMYDHEISHSLYYKDTEGELIEIYADTDIDWQERLVNPIKPSLDKWVPGITPPSPRPHYVSEPVFKRHDDALFHATHVTHAVLAVADLAAATTQYRRVLGLRHLWGEAKDGAIGLGGSCGLRDLTLLQAGEDRAPGLQHFGFAAWSEADLRASVANAKAAGLPIESESDNDWRLSVMVKDPDGFMVQLHADRRILEDGVGLPGELMMHVV